MMSDDMTLVNESRRRDSVKSQTSSTPFEPGKAHSASSIQNSARCLLVKEGSALKQGDRV